MLAMPGEAGPTERRQATGCSIVMCLLHPQSKNGQAITTIHS